MEKYNRKTICLFSSCELAIPAVQGGAIETLITNLIDQNEIEKRVDFIVVTNYVKEAEKLYGNYKYTKFLYLEKDLDKSKRYEKIIRCIQKTLCRLTKGRVNLPLRLQYFEKGRNSKLQTLQADYIVAEGGAYYSFQYFAKKIGSDRMYLHIHHELFGNPMLDRIFGNVIGVSEFALNQYLKTSSLPREKGRVVYNCVDEDKFKKILSFDRKGDLRKKLGFSENDFIVFYSGRIVREKGVMELVKAVISLENENIKLLIAGAIKSALGGSSEYYLEILNMIEHYPNRIMYIGYIDNSELYQYYQIADAQVVPSVWEEVAGLVTIEGMLSGIPLIVTNSGGMVEYVDDGSVIKVDRGRNLSENIARELQYLYDHPQEAKERGVRLKQYAERFSKRNFYYEFLKAIGGK